MFNRYFVDNVSKQIVFVCATISLLILFLIVIFILKEGFPAFTNIGLAKFLFGTEWSLKEEEFSILPLIIGSILATLGTVVMATPLSIACAVFLSEVAPRRISSLLRQAIEVLAGIPSVVYGLVGMIMLVPIIRQLGGSGYSLLAGIVVLTIMVLPTMVTITEDSLRAVPVSYKEAALALGATQWQAIWMVLLPAARSGITAAFILGMARAIGETMAVYMVIGNAFAIPRTLLDPSRTLTSHIVGQILESAAGSLHLSALFAVGIVLVVFILVFNSIAFLIRRKTL
ncbi:MAG TPA: phosphate ABC transporter permease subunit PstC [Desulfotomaculum sp.]|nr:MAG: Phosphate ABC transporter membrane protein 1, PhoT family [Desulfotomaculum sp. 46_80]KUK85143.1 MAG: Phosphate ABC transporter membrane protein 1, PhoT family [Desulfofundulus kuznetsovii]HAG09879.1 phosphate ABC transporter permease subunit PstC [Desulfotomaculum sp.]HBY04587.1 phosphate ABC transporter permease subunit PstC [Desulfotomaculum sp.]